MTLSRFDTDHQCDGRTNIIFCAFVVRRGVKKIFVTTVFHANSKRLKFETFGRSVGRLNVVANLNRAEVKSLFYFFNFRLIRIRRRSVFVTASAATNRKTKKYTSRWRRWSSTMTQRETLDMTTGTSSSNHVIAVTSRRAWLIDVTRHAVRACAFQCVSGVTCFMNVERTAARTHAFLRPLDDECWRRRKLRRFSWTLKVAHITSRSVNRCGAIRPVFFDDGALNLW